MNMNRSLRVGFADTIVTPALNAIYQDGYGHRVTPAVEVRDALHAKVMAVTDGKRTQLLFSIDLIGLNDRLWRLVCDQITALCGVPRQYISLVCTHTHSAPQAGIISEMPIDTDYFAYLGELCGRAALRAMERACAGSFRAEVLPEQLLHAINRRGRSVIDRRIRAACFYDESGVLRGVICHAACHAVINTSYAISADFLCELNAISNDTLPYIYFQGRAADINPWQSEQEELSAEDWIATLGRELTVPVQRFAAREEVGAPLSGEVCTRFAMVTVPMKTTTAAAAREHVALWGERYFAEPIESWNKHYYLRELQWGRHMLRIAEEGREAALQVPLQLITLGEAFAFAMVPFELLTLAGDHIEALLRAAGYGEAGIYVCGYANSCNGYLASAEEFPHGGYEVSGAAHWYNIPETCERTAATVVDWFAEAVRTPTQSSSCDATGGAL